MLIYWRVMHVYMFLLFSHEIWPKKNAIHRGSLQDKLAEPLIDAIGEYFEPRAEPRWVDFPWAKSMEGRLFSEKTWDILVGLTSRCDNMWYWLVVTGTMEFWMTFHSVGNGIIIPTDELHHFSEGWWAQPPTRCDMMWWSSLTFMDEFEPREAMTKFEPIHAET